ncbi:MAG: hypothetical protein JEZ07_07320 [Phycisphaerae bacterium]|nr:hypothetical protein [Phycisphaerae bacterium]
MPNAVDDIINQRGFKLIGNLTYNLQLQLWWHPKHCIQIIIAQIDDKILIKGSKSYYLRSMSQESQTWARDIPGLHDYLLSHFPECHIALAHFRDINKTIIGNHLRSTLNHTTPSTQLPDLQEIRQLQTQQEDYLNQRQRLNTLSGVLNNANDTLGSYLKQKSGNCQAK